MKKYKRRDVGKAIVMALRDLGGLASRKQRKLKGMKFYGK